jgi:hypothetical protein
MILALAIAEMGSRYGFTKQLPKEKPLKIIIRLIRYCFGVITIILMNKILDQDFIKTLFSSKSFIVAIWLWIMFELFLTFLKENKKETFQPDAGEGPGTA